MSPNDSAHYERMLKRANRRIQSATDDRMKDCIAALLDVYPTRDMTPRQRRKYLRDQQSIRDATRYCNSKRPPVTGPLVEAEIRRRLVSLWWNRPLLAWRLSRMPKPDDAPPPENIHDAAEAGDRAAVLQFLEQGVSVDEPGERGLNPLQIAVRDRHLCSFGDRVGTIRALLEAGASTEVQDCVGYTPLIRAAHEGFKGAVEELLMHGADPIARHGRQAGDSPIKFVPFGAAIFDDCETSESDAESIATMILDAESSASDIPVQDSALPFITSILKSTGVDHERYIVRARQLLEHGRDPNLGFPESDDDYRGSAFHMAAAAGAEPFVTLMIQYGAKLNARTIRSETPLHLAATSGSVETVRALITAGADIGSRTEQGVSPVLCGAAHVDVLRCFHELGADLRVRDIKDQSIVHYAASSDESLAFLRAQEHDLFSQDVDGKTPLVVAAERRSIEGVEYLLKIGADPNPINKDGVPVPINIQTDYNQSAGTIIDLLKTAGANRVVSM